MPLYYHLMCMCHLLISFSSTTETPVLSLFSQVTCHVAVSLMTIKSSRVQETPHGEPQRSEHTGVQVQTCFFPPPELICVLNCARSASVHCGTSRRVSRPRFSLATPATSWACPCRPTSALLCQEPATPRSNCGTSGTACAGRPSRATSRTSTPSVWVCSVSCSRTVQGSNNWTSDGWATALPPEPTAAPSTTLQNHLHIFS